jgi:hypothetical protein
MDHYGQYYEIKLNRQDRETALITDALHGHLYFTTEHGVQKVASNYKAEPVLTACLISTEN